MLAWISTFLDRIFAVLGAILLMQFPMFIDQYTFRLAGHVDELNYQINKVETLASQSQKTLEQYIKKFLLSKDSDFEAQGKLLEEMRLRDKKLSDSLKAILNGNFLTRPFILLFQSDWTVIRATCSHYKLGISLTFEGIFYGIIGIFLGYYLYKVLSLFAVRVYHGFSRARKKEMQSSKNRFPDDLSDDL